jgi:hypothetical protein
LNREKLEWQKEIEMIQQIQPIDDIVELNVGGKEDFCIRKSTLCQIKGSALEALFSGRHVLSTKNDRVFIDRNPFAFNLMIDYLRNGGLMHEQQKNNPEMLKVELKYWCIDEKLFKQRA